MSAQTTLQAGVRERLDSPSSDQDVRLLVDYTDSEEQIVDTVHDLGGTINKRLIRNTISITIPETGLERLTGMDEVTYVEIEEAWEQMGTTGDGDTNFR